MGARITSAAALFERLLRAAARTKRAAKSAGGEQGNQPRTPARAPPICARFPPIPHGSPPELPRLAPRLPAGLFRGGISRLSSRLGPRNAGIRRIPALCGRSLPARGLPGACRDADRSDPPSRRGGGRSAGVEGLVGGAVRRHRRADRRAGHVLEPRGLLRRDPVAARGSPRRVRWIVRSPPHTPSPDFRTSRSTPPSRGGPPPPRGTHGGHASPSRRPLVAESRAACARGGRGLSERPAP